MKKKRARASRRGRPRADQVETRNTELLDAATEVFLEVGFAGAKMSAIAKRAGASMETLYARFPTKAELFAALIERKSSGLLKIVGPLHADRSPREALTKYAEELVTMMTMAETQKLHRLVIAGSIDNPDLGAKFWDAGPGRGFGVLFAYLGQQKARGTLCIDDVGRAAGLFMGMTVGGIALRATLGMPTTIESARDRQVWAEYVVDKFLSMLV